MKNNTIENITEYAKNATDIEEPSEYATGVKVGWTAPAKWWNWLMNAFSKRLGEIYETVKSIHEEIKNAVGGTLDENSNTQLKGKFDAIYNEKGAAEGFATLDDTGLLTTAQRPLSTAKSLGCILSDIGRKPAYAMTPAAGDFFGSTEVPATVEASGSVRLYYNYLLVGTHIVKMYLNKSRIPVITKIPFSSSSILRAVACYTEVSIHLVNHAGGIAVGDNGVIVDIDYLNNTVNVLPSPTTERLNGVAVIGDKINDTVTIGYIAVGDNGTLIIDGHKIDTDTTVNFTAVCANVNTSAVAITAEDGSVYIYNGALSKIIDGNGTALRCVCPSTENSSSFIAAGDSGYCISFSITEHSQISGISKNVTGISAMLKDTRHIYVLVGDGFAYKYTASGGFNIIQGTEGSLKTVFSHLIENGTSEEVIAAGLDYLIEDMISGSSAARICRFPYKLPNWPTSDSVRYNYAMPLYRNSGMQIVLLAGNAKQFLLANLWQYITASISDLPQFPIISSDVEINTGYTTLNITENKGRYVLAGAMSPSLGYIIASSYSYADSAAVIQGAINTAPVTSVLIIGDTLTANDKIYLGTKKVRDDQINGLYRISYSSTDKTPDTSTIETLAEFESPVIKLVMFNSNLYVLTQDLKLYRYVNINVLETVMTVTSLNTAATNCYVDNDNLLILCKDGHIIKYTEGSYSIINTGYSIGLNDICKYKGLYIVACDNGTILYSQDLATFIAIRTGDGYNLKTMAVLKFYPYIDSLIIAGENWSAVYAYTVDASYNLVVANDGFATIPILKQFEERIAALEAKS